MMGNGMNERHDFKLIDSGKEGKKFRRKKEKNMARGEKERKRKKKEREKEDKRVGEK